MFYCHSLTPGQVTNHHRNSCDELGEEIKRADEQLTSLNLDSARGFS